MAKAKSSVLKIIIIILGPSKKKFKQFLQPGRLTYMITPSLDEEEKSYPVFGGTDENTFSILLLTN